MFEEDNTDKSKKTNPQGDGRIVRRTNILAAILGLFLFLSSMAMLLTFHFTQMDRIFPILTSCCGLGLIFYAVGDEARIFSQSINIVGASAISLTMFFVWNKFSSDEARYRAEAHAVWKDPKNAAEILDGPIGSKPHQITIGLKSRLVKGTAEENNEGNGYKFNLTLSDRDVSDFFDTACPFIRITFHDGRKKLLHFSKATRITPNDYNIFFILKYYLDNEVISATRDKEFFLPACNSEKDAAAKDARQIEKDEAADTRISDEELGRPSAPMNTTVVVPKVPTPYPTNPQTAVEPVKQPENQDTKVQPIIESQKLAGYIIFSRFNSEKPKRNKIWFEIEGKPDAQFPAPGDTLRALEDGIALRGYPFRWDEKSKKHLLPSAPLANIKKDQKIIVSSDASIATDENNGDLYAIVPIRSVVGLEMAQADVMPSSFSSESIVGYTYIGYVDPASKELNSSFFKNITKPDADYPGPNDILVANRGVWLRAGPRRWDPARQSYIQDREVRSILKGQYIQLGGDVVLSKGGNSIWAPVAKIYENGALDFADKN